MAVAVRRAPAPGVRPRPRLRVVPGSRSRRRVPFLFLAVVLVTTIVIGLTSAQALLAEGAFRVTDLSRQAEQLDVANDLLRLEVARLSSPDRVAREAADAGLIRPRRVETLPPEAGG